MVGRMSVVLAIAAVVTIAVLSPAKADQVTYYTLSGVSASFGSLGTDTISGTFAFANPSLTFGSYPPTNEQSAILTVSGPVESGTYTSGPVSTDSSVAGFAPMSGSSSNQLLLIFQDSLGSLPDPLREVDIGSCTNGQGCAPESFGESRIVTGEAVPSSQLVITNPAAPSPGPVNIASSALPKLSGSIDDIAGFLGSYDNVLPVPVEKTAGGALADIEKVLTSKNVKDAAGIAAPVVKVASTILNVLSLKSLVKESGVAFIRDASLVETQEANQAVGEGLLAYNGPDAATNISDFAGLALDLAATGVACSDGVGCAVAVLGTLGDGIGLGLDTIHNDPPDPNYQNVFALPTTLAAPVFQVDPDLNNAVGAFELANAYLIGTDASLDRYNSAIATGDSSSAVLQLEALLQYLDLFTTSLDAGNIDLKLFLNSPDAQALLSQEYDAGAFEQEIEQLLAEGLSPDDLNALSDLGIDPTTFTGALANYVPPGFNGTAGDDLAALSGGLDQFSHTSAVPEPSSLAILSVGLIVIFIGWRRRVHA